MPLVNSVDGMACHKTKMAERHLASLQLAWWRKEYSEMVGYIWTQMYMSLLRANTFLIRGSRERRSCSRAMPYMDDGEAMLGWHHWRDLSH
jgi:hypothetical protein